MLGLLNPPNDLKEGLPQSVIIPLVIYILPLVTLTLSGFPAEDPILGHIHKVPILALHIVNNHLVDIESPGPEQLQCIQGRGLPIAPCGGWKQTPLIFQAPHHIDVASPQDQGEEESVCHKSF